MYRESRWISCLIETVKETKSERHQKPPTHPLFIFRWAVVRHSQSYVHLYRISPSLCPGSKSKYDLNKFSTIIINTMWRDVDISLGCAFLRLMRYKNKQSALGLRCEESEEKKGNCWPEDRKKSVKLFISSPLAPETSFSQPSIWNLFIISIWWNLFYVRASLLAWRTNKCCLFPLLTFPTPTSVKAEFLLTRGFWFLVVVAQRARFRAPRRENCLPRILERGRPEGRAKHSKKAAAKLSQQNIIVKQIDVR